MPRSISNKLSLLFTAATITLSLGAQEPVDDAALKRSFEEGLDRIHDSGAFPAPAAIRRQLSQETTFEGNLSPPAKTEAADIYQQSRKATLVVGHLYLCDKCDNWHPSIAGGVVISPDGLALTNYHVLDFDRASIFGAMTAEGETFAISEVLAASKKHDIALIRLNTEEELPFVSIAETAPISSSVYVISHPDSHFYTLTKGYISRYSLKTRHKVPRLEITADFARGSSGSGVYNEEGQLVGLVAATNSIYYNEDKEVQKHLQMVIKTCVPLSGIRQLFSADRD